MELEVVKKLVPKSMKYMITQDFIDKIENCVKNKDIAEVVKENFVTYIDVLTKGQYKMDDYINAVKYVSCKLLGYSNIDAYAITFPDRYARYIREGQQVDAYASMYNKNKLVTQIFEQTIVPSYILNQPLYQKALNQLADMLDDPSVRGMAKVKACETILNYTKAPEVVKNELTIGIAQQDTISELRDVTERLADTFREALVNNQTTLKDVTNTKIIDVTPEEE